MRLHLSWQLPFFLAMLVSSASPVVAQRDSVEEQAKQIYPKFIDTPSLSEFVFGTWPRTLRKNTGVATFWQRSSATSQTEEALLVLINMEGPVVLEML